MPRPATSGWPRRAHAVRQGRRRAGALDAIELSVPVREWWASSRAGEPDLVVWGAVVPNLAWSNIAREVLIEAGLDPPCPPSPR